MEDAEAMAEEGLASVGKGPKPDSDGATADDNAGMSHCSWLAAEDTGCVWLTCTSLGVYLFCARCFAGQPGRCNWSKRALAWLPCCTHSHSWLTLAIRGLNLACTVDAACALRLLGDCFHRKGHASHLVTALLPLCYIICSV